MAPRCILPVLPQRFSLTYSMMNYIRIKYPPPLQSKFIQSCKYFLQKWPVIVVNKIEFGDDDAVVIFDENEKVTVDLMKIYVSVYCVKEFKILTNASWSIFMHNGIIRGALRNRTYSDLNEIAPQGIITMLAFHNPTFIDSDDIPVPLEDIISLFENVRSYKM